jgi:hypothetical protein
MAERKLCFAAECSHQRTQPAMTMQKKTNLKIKREGEVKVYERRMKKILQAAIFD